MSVSPSSLAELQTAIGYSFRDPSLLSLALRHKSVGQPNNERLEFLGDAILGAIVAEALYKNPSPMAEGSLTVARANLVSGAALTRVAQALSLHDVLLLGKGERSSGHVRDSILEDAFEAVVGAVFLDSNFDKACSVVLKLLGEKLAVVEDGGAAKDPKTELQELMQSRKSDLPRYEVVGTEGPPHDRIFTVSCQVSILADGDTRAQGRSRRAAEQDAAKAMLEKIQGFDAQ